MPLFRKLKFYKLLCIPTVFLVQYHLILIFFCRTVLLSIISLLNEPNTFSPANVDASVMFRKFKDSKGRDKEYENIIRYEECVNVRQVTLAVHEELVYIVSCHNVMKELTLLGRFCLVINYQHNYDGHRTCNVVTNQL